MKFYTLEMSEFEKEFVLYALLSTVEKIIDKIEDSGEDIGEQMSAEESAKAVIDNVIANANQEIATLKEQLAERTKKKTNDAPYGYKKDGTPKKRPGRPAKKGKK